MTRIVYQPNRRRFRTFYSTRWTRRSRARTKYPTSTPSPNSPSWTKSGLARNWATRLWISVYLHALLSLWLTVCWRLRGRTRWIIPSTIKRIRENTVEKAAWRKYRKYSTSRVCLPVLYTPKAKSRCATRYLSHWLRLSVNQRSSSKINMRNKHRLLQNRRQKLERHRQKIRKHRLLHFRLVCRLLARRSHLQKRVSKIRPINRLLRRRNRQLVEATRSIAKISTTNC